MGISGFASLNAIPDRTPNRQCWLLFRAGSFSRLREFQQGKMYMNSVQYFSEMEGESLAGLRRDILEKNYLKLYSKVNGEKISELLIEIEKEEVSLGDNASLHLDLPSPRNIFVFCMAALADGPDGKIPGEVYGEVSLSRRFMEFGSHMLIIKNNVEFSKRLNSAISSHPHLYSSDFFEGGYGQVEYMDTVTHSGLIGLFRKDVEFSWQREYRICFGASSEALNSNGALELNIGDMSDITQIIPMHQLISAPIKLRRGIIKKVDGEMTHQYIEDSSPRNL